MFKFNVCAAVGLTLVAVSAPLALADGSCDNLNLADFGLAICNQNLARVQLMVDDQGVDVNAKDSQGRTPLDIAFHSGSVYWMPVEPGMGPVIQYLLDRGANPNTPFSSSGDLPLNAAAYTGNMILTPALVAAGADLNGAGPNGVTPAMDAASCDFRLSCDDCTQTPDSYNMRWSQGALPVLKFLASKGARIDQKVLDTFATPCSQDPKLCAPDTIDKAEWPSGTCKQSYLFVKHLVSGTH